MDNDEIPPSSPPHASTANFPSSPCFESHQNAYSLKSSSPPPLFSSDDSRESIDVTNYESPRIYKNKRKGAWWDTADSAQNTPESKKTKMSRNFDSGVYMMSDASDSIDSLLPIHKSPFPLSTGPDLSADREPAPRIAMTPRKNRTLGDVFNERIREGLDKGSECFELRQQGFEDDDIHEIGELDSIIKGLPDPGSEQPAEGQYRSMVPDIYVNLSANRLHYLTPSMFDVRYLTTLVLRNNAIEQLPQQIRQLTNLRVLDLSLNNLRTLPLDLTDLFAPEGQLERVTLMGNPLLEPMTVELYENKWASFERLEAGGEEEHSELISRLYASLPQFRDPEVSIWTIRIVEAYGSLAASGPRGDKNKPIHVARTPIAYFDQGGDLLRGSPSPSTYDSEEYVVVIPTSEGVYVKSTLENEANPKNTWFSPPSTSSVSSLLTTTVHSALKERHQDDLTILDVQNMLPNPIPHTAAQIFHRASENDEHGYGDFRGCHTCKKEYIVARAEWIEFWALGLHAQIVPLQARVCSWGCVPREYMTRPDKMLLG